MPGASGCGVLACTRPFQGLRTSSILVTRLLPRGLREGHAKVSAAPGGSPAVTIRAHHLALLDLLEDALPTAVGQACPDVEELVAKVIELEDDGVRLAAVGARMLLEEPE